jgi:hypothetical protein
MARALKSVHLLVLACAGASGFYIAAQWSRGHLVGSSATDDVAAPTAYAATSPATSASAPFHVASGSTASPEADAAPASAPGIDSSASSASNLTGEVAADAASASSRTLVTGRADRTRVIPGPTGDPFASLSWLPPPPPPVPVAPVTPPKPAKPVAPPLPYTFVGMVGHQSGKSQVFLAKNDALLIVSAGDVLDNGAYRVESLDASQIVLTHVPTSTQQTINVSGGAK